MYYIYGASGTSLLIESTDSMIFFRLSFFLIIIVSACQYLEGIKDALSECSGLVRTVGQCAKTWWPWRSRCTREHEVQSASVQHSALTGQATEPLAKQEAQQLFSIIPYLFRESCSIDVCAGLKRECCVHTYLLRATELNCQHCGMWPQLWVN